MVERLAGPGLVRVMSRVWFAFSLAELGRFEEALSVVAEALPAVEAAAGHPCSLARLHYALARLRLEQGHLDAAVVELKRSQAVVERFDIILEQKAVSAALGSAAVLGGDFATGIPALERSVEDPLPRSLPGLARRLADAYRLSGRIDDARNWSARAMAHARRTKSEGDEAWILPLDADLAAAPSASDLPAALSRSDEARVFAESLQMKLLVARCRLGAGLAAARAGDDSRAAAELEAAIASMREMDMGLWLGQAERALAAVHERHAPVR
jgi:tetratricopeptide (TPR) repeat protein